MGPTFGSLEKFGGASQALAKNIIVLLDEYGILKDQGAIFNEITLAFKFVLNCELFGWDESFQNTCFGHAFSKACQWDNIKMNLQKFHICFH
jgi:hypothetical protein